MSRRKRPPIQTPMTSVSAQQIPAPAASVTQRSWRPQILLGVTSVMVVLFIVMASGRGFFSRGSTAKVEAARRMLQIGRAPLAIEALAKEDSAEGHYLKAVALQEIGQSEGAREQIAEAISIAPHEVKYQGYNLLLQLSNGNPEVANELIKLYEIGPSSTGIAFFATNAFTKKKPPDVRAALRAFELGITLIDETPEFMSNAMHFAVTTLQQVAQLGDEKLLQQKVAVAERLLEKLEQVAPKDVDLLKDLLSWSVRGKLVATSQRLLKRITELKEDGPDIAELRIMVELLLGQTDSAVAAAKQAVSDNPDDPTLELMLAEAVWKSTPTPQHEKILSDLAAKHPENPEFIAKHALFLAKAKRIGDAVAIINHALSTTKAPEPRSALLKLAVGIPLEANNAELSEQQVNRFKGEFHNPKLVSYFEGRVLFLKKDFAGAKQQFQKVLTEQRISNESDRMLAAECLIWQQRILKSELFNAKKAASDETLKASKPDSEKAPMSAPVKDPVEKK